MVLVPIRNKMGAVWVLHDRKRIERGLQNIYSVVPFPNVTKRVEGQSGQACEWMAPAVEALGLFRIWRYRWKKG